MENPNQYWVRIHECQTRGRPQGKWRDRVREWEIWEVEIGGRVEKGSGRRAMGWQE